MNDNQLFLVNFSMNIRNLGQFVASSEKHPR
jgi:hypothetical protein